MSLAGRRIGFIGGGAMAEALAGGLLASGITPSQIRIAEPRAERRAELKAALGLQPEQDNAAVVGESDLLVIAVKPGIVATALTELSERSGSGLDLGERLWISIAAGVRLEALESGLGVAAPIVRAMPNTPALVGEGATAICGNAHAGAADLAAARSLFEGVGCVWETGEESLLDAVTGLSGSGPAYVFLLLEALIAAGEAVGLPPEAAEQLVFQTVRGAAGLAIASDRSPAQLREQVSSPGGTTLAGLKALEEAGFREAIRGAVEAAVRRSVELGRGEER
jgi:pyrroline-5-carboxylate reductase